MKFCKHICEPPWQNVKDNDQLTGVKMSECCMICSCCESKKKSKCFAHSPCQKLRNARQDSFLLSMVINASRERCQKRCSIFSGRKRPPDFDICDWMRLWQVFNDRLSCAAILLG